MISLDEAYCIVAGIARPLPYERVPLRGAFGRVLAGPVTAQLDMPPSDLAAMDGYAVRECDLTAIPARLKVIGQSWPSKPFLGRIEAGQCVRILTGAPVPAGADRVIMQENVTRQDDAVVVREGTTGKPHIRPLGYDFRKGALLLDAGTRLTAGSMVTAAAADHSHVLATRQPRVAIIATGDELTSPGEATLRHGGIPESASFGISAVASQWGALVEDCLRVPDDLDQMVHVARRARVTADVIVVIGGASVGDRDHGKAMFADLQFGLLFSKVAIRPGKPVWLGRSANCIVLGLPGNPTAAMVTARLFLIPLILGLTGRDPGEGWDWRRHLSSAPLSTTPSRECLIMGTMDEDRFAPLGDQNSSGQRAIAQMTHIARCPREPAAWSPNASFEILKF